MSDEKYTVGVDFGTLSGRALVVRVSDGHELASAEHAYEHGVITDALPGSAVRLPSQWALQVPGDYINVLRTDGTPLCELDEFGDRPHAYVKLWRHHSPQPQADRINTVAAQRNEYWLK